MKRYYLKTTVVIIVVVGLHACTPDKPPVETDTIPGEPAVTLPATPQFDPDSAYQHIQTQVDFGPRVPGNESHIACGDWLAEKLKANGGKVIEQRGSVTAFNGKQLPLRNIIASWQKEKKERILLFAHWDTRPFADQDETRMNEPIDGANDGGSGVGILLEIARHLSNAQTTHGVDIIFFDVEDYGQPSGGVTQQSSDTWCLGSQYWARNIHVPDYNAKYGILLDMCGAKDAKFYQEAISMNYAPHIVRKVWKTAHNLGYGNFFVEQSQYYVGIDDHTIVNRELKIPSIDIIEYHAPTEGFHPSWHTHADNMDIIDRATLKAVGQTVMEVVWQER